MKNKVLLSAIGTSILFSSCLMHGRHSKIKYTDLPAEGKVVPVQSFNAIKANGIFNIYLKKGNTESVVIKNEYPDDLMVTNDASTLVLMDTTSNRNISGDIRTNIYITYKQLNTLELELVGKSTTEDTINAESFNFISNGVGESNLLLNADSVMAAQDGVGALNIAGKARYASIDDNGVGALNAKGFKVSILHVSVNGVGAAKVYADSEIYLQVNGVGGLKYYGPAKVMDQASGGVGKVEHGE
jgi:hypothetical protein